MVYFGNQGHGDFFNGMDKLWLRRYCMCVEYACVLSIVMRQLIHHYAIEFNFQHVGHAIFVPPNGVHFNHLGRAI